MAKNDVFQIVITAPGLEAAIKGLTEAIVKSGASEVTIPAGTAMQITGVQSVAAPALAAQSVTQQAAPAPAPVASTAPQAAAPAPVAQLTHATQQAVPAPVAPTAQGITLDAIVQAGARLVEAGQMNQVIALLGKYGVQAVNQIQPPQYEAFAAELRALGAQI